MSQVLVKKRSGEFVKLSETDANKLIEDGRAVLYDLKTSRHKPFKPIKMKVKALSKRKKASLKKLAADKKFDK